jgi:hypothetical protein
MNKLKNLFDFMVSVLASMLRGNEGEKRTNAQRIEEMECLRYLFPRDFAHLSPRVQDVLREFGETMDEVIVLAHLTGVSEIKFSAFQKVVEDARNAKGEFSFSHQSNNEEEVFVSFVTSKKERLVTIIDSLKKSRKSRNKKEKYASVT